MVGIGKLKDLWEQLKSLDENSPLRDDIQKQINKTEQWCIDNGIAGFTSITNFASGKSSSNIYPWTAGAVWLKDISMVGDLNGKGINYGLDGEILP